MVQTDFFSQNDASGGSSLNMPSAPIAQAGASQGGLFDRAILLSLSISSLGTKRKVQSSAVEVDADKSYVHVSKDLLKSPVLVDIKKFDGQTRLWIADRSLPSCFRSGVYLWPIGLVVEAEDYFQRRLALRAPMVERLCDMLPALKAESQSQLGALWNPTEWPTTEKVRQSFTVEYQWVEFGVPGRLREISPELFRREMAKQEFNVKNALDEAKSLLYSSLVELVEHMKDRLSPGEDGKQKRFKNSMVTNFHEFLRLFEFRNLGNFDDLAGVVEQCKQVLSGVTTSEQIRDSETLRARVSAGMQGISEQLSRFVIDGGRRINLEEEPDDTFGDI